MKNSILSILFLTFIANLIALSSEVYANEASELFLFQSITSDQWREINKLNLEGIENAEQQKIIQFGDQLTVLRVEKDCNSFGECPTYFLRQDDRVAFMAKLPEKILKPHRIPTDIYGEKFAFEFVDSRGKVHSIILFDGSFFEILKIGSHQLE